MRVDLRGRQVHVPQQYLDVHELGAGLQEPGRIGVPCGCTAQVDSLKGVMITGL
jgi:hypothetical protein